MSDRKNLQIGAGNFLKSALKHTWIVYSGTQQTFYL